MMSSNEEAELVSTLGTFVRFFKLRAQSGGLTIAHIGLLKERKLEGGEKKPTKKHGRTQFKGWRLLEIINLNEGNLSTLALHKLCEERAHPFLESTTAPRVRLASDALAILHKIQSSTILQNQYKHQWRDILLNMMGDKVSIDLSALREVSNFNCLYLWKNTDLLSCTKGYQPPPIRVFESDGTLIIEICTWNLEHSLELEMDHFFISLKPMTKTLQQSLFLHLPSFEPKNGDLKDQVVQLRVKVPPEFEIENVEVKEVEDRLVIMLPAKKQTKRKTITPTKLESIKELGFEGEFDK